MAQLVVSGAMLACTMGLAPSSLQVLPMSRVMGSSMPAANIQDSKPLMNILPFGMCNSIANPTVAAATAAALGVLTPMPCLPNIPGPWLPGSPTVMVGGKPAVNNNCKTMCAYAGQISITYPGQVTISVA